MLKIRGEILTPNYTYTRCYTHEKDFDGEDNENLRSLLTKHIEKFGYKVIALDQFNNILDKFLEKEPDIVLLDINLPSYDGFYWCRQIRQHPIVGRRYEYTLTGYNEDGEEKEVTFSSSRVLKEKLI